MARCSDCNSPSRAATCASGVFFLTALIWCIANLMNGYFQVVQVQPWGVGLARVNGSSLVVGRFIAPAVDMCCAGGAPLVSKVSSASASWTWACAGTAAPRPCPPRAATDAQWGACESCASDAAAGAFRASFALAVLGTALSALAFCSTFCYIEALPEELVRGPHTGSLPSACRRACCATYAVQGGAAVALTAAAALGSTAASAYAAALAPTKAVSLGPGWHSGSLPLGPGLTALIAGSGALATLTYELLLRMGCCRAPAEDAEPAGGGTQEDNAPLRLLTRSVLRFV